MALKCTSNVETLEVLGRVPSDGDVIVVDDDLYVQLLGNSEAGSLGVVALLLRAIGAEAKDYFVSVCHGDAVHHCPHVAEAAR